MIKLFFKGLKVGLFLNIILFAGLIAYVLTIENWLTKPVEKFNLPLELGTVVDSVRLFDQDVPSMKLRKSWLNIENNFNYFVIEYQLRSDYAKPYPRLLKWCKQSNCFAHRIDYGDKRKSHFRVFTLDDWFTNNYLIFSRPDIELKRLDLFFKNLPLGSTVIISEPFSTFDRPQVFDKFSEWVLALRSQHPQLKFEIGLQIHLQWADAFWFKNYWILEELSQFSKTHNYPWGVSEFSTYDQIWKRRIRGRSATDRLFYKIEGLIPRRLRRAVVLHGSYIVHRESVKHGAVRFTEWGNIQQTAWFVREIDSDYDSNYELFDSSGTPTALWWAGIRGLKDGQN
ncbi:hypothetical protein QUB37_07315 [Microcoleus sp. AT3-A2]|uniref:hypothetical protein n=1 Tax=Microcoleus sp. AT3-A2 TaxID=2818610 RepID=UPI002FD5B22A